MSFPLKVSFPNMKRGLFQADFKIFDCCFLKAEDYPHCHLSLPVHQTPWQRRAESQEADSSTEFLDFTPSTNAFKGTFHSALFVFGKCGCINPPPLQKKTPIKGETGPGEDSRGEIQPAEALMEGSQSAGSTPEIKMDSHLPLTQVQLERRGNGPQLGWHGSALALPMALAPTQFALSLAQSLAGHRCPCTTINQHTK